MFPRVWILNAITATSMLALSLTAAQAAPHDAHHAGTHHQSSKATSKATRAYKDAMQTMHKNMRVPLSGNADVDFVRQMIPHHQGALEMAKIQQRYGHDPKLKKFNDWVITAQTQEIAQMKNWLDRRDNGAVVKGAKDYYGEAMKRMHHAMMLNYTNDADVDYVNGMIAHHQGAVDMVTEWLKDGTDPEMKELAHDIYNAQTQEIAWLKHWLANRGK